MLVGIEVLGEDGELLGEARADLYAVDGRLYVRDNHIDCLANQTGRITRITATLPDLGKTIDLHVLRRDYVEVHASIRLLFGGPVIFMR
jgi:hypothetical protein